MAPATLVAPQVRRCVLRLCLGPMGRIVYFHSGTCGAEALPAPAVPGLGRVLYPPPTANSVGRQGRIASAARREDITTASRLRGLTSSDITLHTGENSSVGRARVCGAKGREFKSLFSPR